MRKWTLACAAIIVAELSALPALAQEPAPIPPSVVTTSQPVTVTSRGLFRRRNREVVMTAPVTQTSMAVVQSTPAPIAQVPSNVAMTQQVVTYRTGRFGRRTMQEVVMVPVTPMQPAVIMPPVQQAQVTLPAVTTTPVTPTTTTVAQGQVVETRQGLLGRFRARRGR